MAKKNTSGAPVFKEGDILMYRRYGICKVLSAEMQSFGDSEKLYYSLEPIYAAANTKFFVPADLENIDRMLRPLLTKKELDDAIKDVEKVEFEWINDVRERQSRFDDILKKGSTKDLLWLMKILNLRKKKLKESGRVFLENDKRFLAAAERLITDEIAYVAGIEKQDVEAYILKKIKG